MPAAEVSVFRYLIGMIPLFLSPSFVANQPFGTDGKGLLLRGLLGGGAATAFFVGIQMTSLTNAIMLNASYIVWGPLLAIPWAGRALAPPVDAVRGGCPDRCGSDHPAGPRPARLG